MVSILDDIRLSKDVAPLLGATVLTIMAFFISGIGIFPSVDINTFYYPIIILFVVIIMAFLTFTYFDKIRVRTADDVYVEMEREDLEERNKQLDKKVKILSKKIEGLESQNNKAYSEIFLLENELRRFVEKKMIRRWGASRWESKIPTVNNVRSNCKKIKEIAKKNSKLISFDPKLSLLAYSTLHELALVIKEQNNWENVFKNVFPGKDESIIVGDIEKLAQFRHQVAHNRPISEKEFSRVKSTCESIMELIS